jgi:hypothetical protein
MYIMSEANKYQRIFRLTVNDSRLTVGTNRVDPIYFNGWNK